MKYVESLRKSLENILSINRNNILMGEDISDPYGGAFKVTKGLSTQFPDQTIHTPISESGFVGVATGMAYMGFMPIVEIMFCDFLTLIVDMLVNTSSKLDWLSQGRMKGSLLIRTPSGGRRGYGPIHSQSLEKLFFGWPDISVIAPNIVSDPGELLNNTFNYSAKVKIFIENKTDYPKNIINDNYLNNMGFSRKIIGSDFPTTILYNCAENEDPDIFICCYGGLVEHIIQAAYRILMDDEITSKIIVVSKISSPCESTINLVASNNSKILIIEEGYTSLGWSSHLVTQLITSSACNIPISNINIMGPLNHPIPASINLEKEFFPNSSGIIKKIHEIL